MNRCGIHSHSATFRPIAVASIGLMKIPARPIKKDFFIIAAYTDSFIRFFPVGYFLVLHIWAAVLCDFP